MVVGSVGTVVDKDIRTLGTATDLELILGIN